MFLNILFDTYYRPIALIEDGIDVEILCKYWCNTYFLKQLAYDKCWCNTYFLTQLAYDREIIILNIFY